MQLCRSVCNLVIIKRLLPVSERTFFVLNLHPPVTRIVWINKTKVLTYLVETDKEEIRVDTSTRNSAYVLTGTEYFLRVLGTHLNIRYVCLANVAQCTTER